MILANYKEKHDSWDIKKNPFEFQSIVEESFKQIKLLDANSFVFDTKFSIDTFFAEVYGKVEHFKSYGRLDYWSSKPGKANENNLEYTSDQILVSTGCKQSIYNLCQATLDKGDEVLIPSPYWVSYPEIVKLSDATPIFIETNSDTDFKVTGKMLQDNITEKTRMILLNSPSNPSGFIYSEDDLKDIGNVLKNYPDIIIASDDIYEHIIFNNKKFTNILNVCPELYDQTVVLNGVSKAYAMTGWRIGYAAGDASIIGAMKKIQSQSTSCTCSISQAAAKAALDNNNDEVHKMVNEYQIRSAFLHSELNQIDGIKYKKPEGSFYAFVDVNGLIDKIENINDDFELAEYFLNEAGVAVVPGTAFGSKNHIRISFATSLENLKKAVDRIKKLLS